MDKRIVLSIVVILIIIAASGLFYYYSNQQNKTPTPQVSYYPVSVKDASGQNVTFYSQPTRIVSLAPSDTQFLISLGLSRYIVGVDYYSYLLLEMLNITNVLPSNVTVFSASLAPNITGIISLRPDVVIDEIGLIGSYAKELSDAGIKTFYTNADFASNYTEIEHWIILLGKVFNRNDQAQKLINWMEAKIKSFEITGNTTVGYLLWINPDYTFYTAGSGTFINAIISLAGGVNVFQNNKGYPVLSPSSLLIANPQVIIAQELTNITYTYYMIRTMPGISNISAYQYNRIYVLSQNLPTFLFNEPGPLSVYSIAMIKLIILNQAPSYISTAWVKNTLNVTLPIFE
ncbi:MAG: ABC transporter substrate-binding protein [Thermoproteota archaeon]|jgi:ABC-type Fe3+-hydroxamate transport system, periplasmic component